MTFSEIVKGTNPDSVTARLVWRLDQIFAKPVSQHTDEDRELVDLVERNAFAEMSEETFNRMYALLFGKDC